MRREQPAHNLTHLNFHSDYTLLGATPRLEAAVELAARQEMRALALTDTNALYGAVAFAKQGSMVKGRAGWVG